MDYIDSITAKVELEDTKNNIFKISSVLNSNPKNRIPVMYASLNTEEISFFIPEIVIGKDELFSRFQHILNLPKDVLLKGNINNVILNISNSLKFNAERNICCIFITLETYQEDMVSVKKMSRRKR